MRSLYELGNANFGCIDRLQLIPRPRAYGQMLGYILVKRPMFNQFNATFTSEFIFMNKKYFITYGDSEFIQARERIVFEANLTKEFDAIKAYSQMDLSDDLKRTEIINVRRGGGLWSWKPDIIWQAMMEAKNSDIIVYCDAGCTIQKSKEWNHFWDILNSKDLIVQRIFQRNDYWTRKELIDYFAENGDEWLKCYQYAATVVILKVTDFTRKFINEWRNIMLYHPSLAMDVTKEERKYQHSTLIENRHDQAIFSALIYNYSIKKVDKIYTQWEHFEDFDFFRVQAIRATRNKNNLKENTLSKCLMLCKRIIKDFVLKPFYYGPLQCYYEKKRFIRDFE